METPTHAAPPVDLYRLVRRCVTHHFACDCREARFRELLEGTIRAHSTPDNGNYNYCDEDPCEWCREAKALIYHGHPDGVISPTNAGGMARGLSEKFKNGMRKTYRENKETRSGAFGAI